MNAAQKLLAMRLLQQALKVALVWASLKLPRLLPAVEVDGLVDQLAPYAAGALCLAWSALQQAAARPILPSTSNPPPSSKAAP